MENDCFKDNTGKVFQRWVGAHMGFFHLHGYRLEQSWKILPYQTLSTKLYQHSSLSLEPVVLHQKKWTSLWQVTGRFPVGLCGIILLGVGGKVNPDLSFDLWGDS